MTEAAVPRIGCAGWSLARDAKPHFPEQGSHLERYAARFNAVEINSSFYKPHAAAVYAKWAGSVGEDFRFGVKLPKAVTHERRLKDCGELLDAFLGQVQGLGGKLGCLLVQLPPSLALDVGVAKAFFAALRKRYAGAVAVEPRHGTWFGAEADALLVKARVARVLADPVLFDAGRAPGGWPGLVYVRLHGSPRMYWSSYDSGTMSVVARRLFELAEAGVPAWCIFDNTASGAAAHDALALMSERDRALNASLAPTSQ